MTTPAIPVDHRVGARPETTVVTRRVTGTSTRRWALAVAVALVALLGTAGAFLFAAASAPTARLAGWAPAGTIAYAELRLDVASEQDGATARFLANLPGFADRTRLDEKLTELGDRLLERATDGALSYSSMKPWLGDAAAVAIPRVPVSKSDGTALVIVAVRDAAALRDWVAATVPAGGTTGTHAGVQYVTGTTRGMAWAYAVLDTVLLAGERDAVIASIDANGASPFAASAGLRAALGALDGSSVGFAYLDGDAALAGAIAASASDERTALEAMRDAVPSWIVAGLRPTDDALEATVVAPRPALLDGGTFPVPSNRSSELARRLPAETLVAIESRDIGPSLVALAAAAADPARSTGADALAGLGGNVEALVGWMGDGALVVLPAAETSERPFEAGVVALVEDETAALATSRQLRALVTLVGGTGTVVETAPLGDGEIVTVTVADPRALIERLAAASGAEVPAMDATTATAPLRLAWTVQRGLFVAGSAAGFVEGVVAATADGSLAGSERYRAALERAGASNAGQGYLDVPGLVARLVPLLPADERATWDRDLAPFVDVFGGAGGALVVGDPMRVQFVLTVE